MADEDRDGGNALLSALAHPQILNPLAAYSDAAQVANRTWVNREWQAKQAAGEAQQGGIDPATGEYSPNRAMQLLSQRGPTAALAAGPTLESSQRLSDQQLAQAGRKLNWVNAASGAALQSGDFSDAAMERLFAKGIASGMMTPPEVARQRATMPPDAAGRAQWLQEHQMTAASTQQQLDQTYGARQQVNTGGEVQFPLVPPASAGGPGPVVPMTQTPGEKMTGQPTVDPNTGAKGTVPNVSRFNPDGSLKPPGWGNNGKYPTPGSAPAGPTAPPGFTPTEQAPGQAEAQRAAAEASSKTAAGIYSAADAATQQKSQLLSMEADLAKISTGPGSERLAAANALIHKLTGYGITMSAEELASSEGFAKLSKQIALAQAGTLGVGTDEKLTTAMGANPNRDLSKLGNQQILAMLQGNADAIKARGVAYNDWKKTHSGADSNDFLTEFNKTFDPRVYQWGYQIKDKTPAQRQAMFDEMPDKAGFERNYNAAVKRGLINPNGY